MTDKPKTEKKLFDLQTAYFQETDEEKKTKISQEMFSILCDYAKSLLLQCMKNFSVRLTSEEIYDKTVDIVLEVFDKLTAGEQICLSFGGFLNLKVLQYLFSSKLKRLENIKSLNTLAYSGSSSTGEKTELIDLLICKETAFGTPLSTDDVLQEVDFSSELIKNIMEIIVSIFDNDIQFPLKDKIILLVGIFHAMFNKRNLDKYKEMYIQPNKYLVEAFDVIFKEIYNILSSQGVEEDTPRKNTTQGKKALLKRIQED